MNNDNTRKPPTRTRIFTTEVNLEKEHRLDLTVETIGESTLIKLRCLGNIQKPHIVTGGGYGQLSLAIGPEEPSVDSRANEETPSAPPPTTSFDFDEYEQRLFRVIQEAEDQLRAKDELLDSAHVLMNEKDDLLDEAISLLISFYGTQIYFNVLQQRINRIVARRLDRGAEGKASE